MAEYKHKEAFCLMIYHETQSGNLEILWNSRDGVTPFIITSRRGKEAQHIYWPADICAPDFKPPKGMRYFVDATEEIIKPAIDRYIEKHWSLGMGAEFSSKEEAYKALKSSWLKPGSPAILVSGEEDKGDPEDIG